MPITLDEAKKNVQDDLQIGVIDEFRKQNFLLDHLTFDDVVSPTGGGATLTYAYTRLTTQPTAGFRAVNDEYAPQSVSKDRYTADLKIFGGSFEIDRIIAGMGGIVSELDLQINQKIKAAQALFNDTVINGDMGVEADAFDGLDKALTGASTELIPDAAIDLSSSALIDANYKYFLDVLDEFLMLLDGEPTALFVNAKMYAIMRAVARRSAMYSTSLNEFGKQVDMYGPTPFINLGAKSGTNEDVVATDGVDGTTSIYTARFGMDGFHGISMAGQPPIKTFLPDFKTAGAVKKGEVEMVAAVALKATKAAAVLRNIKVK
jgi:hypothetical protein